LIVGCSTGGSGDTKGESDSADSGDVDLEEEIETKAAADDGEEIPSGFPSDLYVSDDAEIQYTSETDLLISFSYTTEMTYEEIKEIYQEFLGDTSMFSDYSEALSEDSDIEYFAAHLSARLEGDPLEIEIKQYDEEEGLHIVTVKLVNNEELEEMSED